MVAPAVLAYNKDMLVLKERLLDLPIMSLQTGIEIAQTEQLIIDPRDLRIIAFYCKGSRLDVHPAILHTEDIREFGDLGLIVDSSDDIMAPEGLVRLQEVLSFGFNLENMQVIEETGRKVGKIINFSIDSLNFLVAKLHVKPGFLQSWTTSELLIDRSQIKEINDDHIVVRAATIPKKQLLRHPLPSAPADAPLQNPHTGASAMEHK